MKVVKRIPLELVFWIGAMVVLWLAEPKGHHEVNHFSFCVLAGMGLDWCPGCGLGRSITQLLHGNLMESLALHWLGIPALLIISHRIGILLVKEIRNFKFKYRRRYV